MGFIEAILSFIMRQVGLRTDTASSTGSVHAKIGQLGLDILTARKIVAPSNNVKIFTNKTYSYYDGVEARLAKLFRLNVQGAVRVFMTLDKSGSGTVNTSIRVNGNYVWSRNHPSDPATYSADISVKIGDELSIWVDSTSNTNAILSYVAVAWDITDSDGYLAIDN